MRISRENVRASIIKHLPHQLYSAQLIWRRASYWRRAGAIFIHIPKNGGTSINTALYGKFMGHYTASEVSRFSPKAFGLLPSFAVTRNPWDRALSAYKFVKAGQSEGAHPGVAISHPERYQTPEFDSFERFVLEWLPTRTLVNEDHVFKPQSYYIINDQGLIAVSFLGRIDRLDEVSKYLENTLNRRIQIGHVNRSSKSGNYRHLYTPEMRDVVAKAYAGDISGFNYEF